MSASSVVIRVGEGYDIHRLVEGRLLILGGVCIPYPRGLQGHSDADALLHSITDALLGAAGLGNIGRHFPDTEPEWRGADSLRILRLASALLKECEWRVSNVDATLIAQAPRLSAFLPEMERNIAGALSIDSTCVNVKAKTNEALGALGRMEGIAARAVALVVRTAAS